MYARGCHFSGGKQAGQRRASATICGDPAHTVVGCRCDRNVLCSPVDAVGFQHGRQLWESACQRACAVVIFDHGGIQEHRCCTKSLHNRKACSGDYITGRKLSIRVGVGQKPIPCGIAQYRTGPSNCFREECSGSCERSGMELDKFHIGHYSPGASCSQQTLPGDRRRRRRRRKQPSITTRCQYHGVGVELLLPRRRSVEHSAETSVGDRQIGYRCLLDDVHTTVVCELLNAASQKR